MENILLRIKPYSVTLNCSKFESLRIVLNALCGFKDKDKVYQVRRPDGVVELIPASKFNPKDYNI